MLVQRRGNRQTLSPYLRISQVYRCVPNPSLFIDTHILAENQLRRSGRANFGQGGAASQLEKVGNDIRPDTELASRKRKSTLADMPENLRKNDMAPPVPFKKPRGPKAKARECIYMSPSTDINYRLDCSTGRPSPAR